MSNCPFCGSGSLTSVTDAKPRPDTHQTVQCDDCKAYSVRHKNGRVYPMDDKTDKNGDPVTRVY